MSIIHFGTTTTIGAVARANNLNWTTVQRRYDKGLRDKDLIKKPKLKKLKYEGRYYTFKDCAEKLGIPYGTLKGRYLEGLRGEQLFCTGHRRKGKVFPGTKLTPAKVLEIYAMAHKEEFSQDEIADRFNIHQSTVSDIKLGRRWGNLTKHSTTTH